MLADDCLLFFVECKKAAGVGKGPLRMGESVQTVGAVIIMPVIQIKVMKNVGKDNGKQRKL